MASDIKEAIRRLLYQYRTEGADEVIATQEAVAASTTKTDKASLSLERAFGSLERRYVDTVRYQQDYAKVQDKVNAAVAQNPELQERANKVLAAAGEHFQNLASRGNFFSEIVVKGFNRFLGPAALVSAAMTGIGAAIGYMAAQWQSSSTTVEQALTETNRLLAEGKKLIDEKTSAQDRMFAQSKDQTQFELLRNELDLQNKLNAAMRETIALAEKRSGMPSQVPGEMGEAPTGFAPSQAPGYKEIADAMENLRNAQAAGLPGLQAFNAELGRIGQAHPEIAATIQELMKSAQAGIALEQAAMKARAISDALAGVATNAQLAAAGLGSIAQFNFNNLHAQEAAAALERMAQAMLRLGELYPGITLDTAKQLELLEAQLRIARARTDEERLLAQERARVLQLTLEGKSAEEATLLAAKERRISEENIAKQREQQEKVTQAARETTDAIEDAAAPIQRNIGLTEEWGWVVDELATKWHAMTIEWGVANRLSMLHPQSAGKQYTSDYDPLWTQIRKQALMSTGRTESDIEPIKDALGNILGWLPKTDLSAAIALGQSLEDLTSSTDALNTTMQAALSPYYSQDPRTTKLGFRAGVVGNQDWLAPGASNANPLAAILGQGATAPGMASGGSFIVGGGYSANDNKIAAFPVASGEQVTVSRAGQDSGAKVINIDNRIIVNGTVDADSLSQMKISRYQQSQRMRAGLAQAS